MKFAVCDRCSTSMTNDDWTWLDGYYEEEYETKEYNEAMAGMMASVEIMGDVMLVGRESNGYFRCFVCGDDEIGENYWEANT